MSIRQKLVSWLQGKAETPESLHHLPRVFVTQSCHTNKAITLFLLLVSLPFICSEIPDMFLFSPAPPLIVNPSSHRNAMHFRCCHFDAIICGTHSLHSLKLWGAESGVFRAVLMCCVCTRCVTAMVSYLQWCCLMSHLQNGLTQTLNTYICGSV